MKRNKILIIVVAIFLSFIIYKYLGISQKDKWVNEPSYKKYSEKRENEVWGEILRGRNPALYYGTPLYDLAETLSGAIWFRDKDEISKLIEEIPKGYVNYQEPKFGMTIGQFALRTNNMFAIRKLLDKGLDANIMDKQGNAIIIDINSSVYSHLPESLETLKYMIKKGANVNLYSERATVKTPLIRAVNSNFENVKVLVEAGANAHFIDELDNYSRKTGYRDPFRSPLSAALLNRDMEIINYLIFDQKVDFRTLKQSMESKFHPGEYQILHKLREKNFDLNSKDYKEKMKLVAYLKTQRLDYRKTPIPDNIKNNPKFTQEYLSKY